MMIHLSSIKRENINFFDDAFSFTFLVRMKSQKKTVRFITVSFEIIF